MKLKDRQRLIELIFTKHGGPLVLSKRLKKCRQTLYDWIYAGEVSFNALSVVTTKLKISPWGLNYLELKKMFENDPTTEVPQWEAVPAMYGISLDTQVTSLIK